MQLPDLARLGAAAIWLGLAGLGAGCVVRTQRYVGPLTPVVEPLPPGTSALYEPGPEEGVVVRHADTVLVRPAGARAGYELRFHDKEARVRAGSWIQTGATGKAEVVLANGTRIELSGIGAGALGSESRREPIFDLRDVTRAAFHFNANSQVRLPGGALLAAAEGSFVVERVGERVLRVRNRSDGPASIAYRDSIMALEATEVVDLAVPPSGSAPFQVDPGFRTLDAGGAAVRVRGEVEVLPAEEGVRLRAAGEHEIVAHGLVLRLDASDEVWIRGIGTAVGESR